MLGLKIRHLWIVLNIDIRMSPFQLLSISRFRYLTSCSYRYSIFILEPTSFYGSIYYPIHSISTVVFVTLQIIIRTKYFILKFDESHFIQLQDCQLAFRLIYTGNVFKVITLTTATCNSQMSMLLYLPWPPWAAQQR